MNKNREITGKDAIYFLLLSVILTFCVVITMKVETNAQMPEVTTEATTAIQETTTEEVETTEATTEEIVIVEETKPITKTRTTTEAVELTTVKFEDVLELIELGTVECTAYCPCHICCHYKLKDGTWNCGGEGSEKCKEMVANPKTSIGKTPKANHTVAVDPSVISYGTELYINGKIYIAEDCGGTVKGNKIDIYFDSHEEAKSFGVKYAKVFIVG